MGDIRSPFLQGLDDGRDGYPMACNPFPKDSLAHAEWDRGWQVGHKELSCTAAEKE